MRQVLAWIKTTEPDVDDDNADADDYWYYFKSSGKAQTKKGTNINGQTYIFDNRGRMLTGWVAKDTDSNAYLEIGDENSDYYLKQFADVYFCGDEDDGHAKKNKWLKTWLPSDTEEEEDDKEWFWFDKNGKLYKTSDSNASTATKYKFEDGKLIIDKKSDGTPKTYEVAKKKVNSKDYWFRTDGVMVSKFYLIDDNMYYFGGADDGSMKTGSQSIKDNAGDTYKFYFYTKDQSSEYESNDKLPLHKGAGVIGNQGNKLYYYGMLIQADDYKYQLATIAKDGVDYSFIVNSNGTIQHSKSTEYKEDGDVLIATGIKNASGKATETKFVENGQFKYAISNEANNWDTVSKNVADIDMSGFVQGK